MSNILANSFENVYTMNWAFDHACPNVTTKRGICMSCTFDAYFESLKGKKIAVLGLGVSNRPVVRLLLEYGCDVTGCDRTPREKLDSEILDL